MAFDLMGALAISPEALLLIITFIGSLIFYAKDFRIGSLLLFLLIVVEFIMVDSLANVNKIFTSTDYHLIALLISFVVLVLSLMFSVNKERYV